MIVLTRYHYYVVDRNENLDAIFEKLLHLLLINRETRVAKRIFKKGVVSKGANRREDYFREWIELLV